MKVLVTFTLLALAVQSTSSAVMEEYVTTKEYRSLLEKIEQNRQLLESMKSECASQTEKSSHLLESIRKEFRSAVACPEKDKPTPTPSSGNCIRRDAPRLPTKTYHDCRSLSARRDCLEHLNNGGKVSGLYVVHHNMNARIEVYCDQETDSGGWTVFQRRRDGSVDFYRDWDSYKKGFGDLWNEFWLGNDNIHMLTRQGSELRVDMEDWENKVYFEKYNTFNVGNEGTKYVLRVSGPSGTAGDIRLGNGNMNGLTYHDGQKFSTYDSDNDSLGGSNCAKSYKGAWWMKSCYYVHLNGYYYKKDEKRDHKTHGYGITWWAIADNDTHRLQFVEMKMRRKQ